jgi:hypothetical protein
MTRIRTLSIVIGVCAIITSVSGLSGNLYSDHPWAAIQLMGQDVVTILLSLLMIFLSFVQNVKVLIIRAGFFGYFAYTYITYAFGPTLNYMFILYVLLMSLSVLGLILIFVQLSAYHIQAEQSFIFPVTSLYLFLVALMLAILWLADIFSTLRGAPLLENPTGEPFLTVYALDLGFVIPVSIYAALTLWRKRTIGFLLSGFMLVKTTTMGFALIAMAISLYVYDYGLEIFLLILWGILGTIGLILTFFFLKKVSFNTQSADSI